MENSVDSSDLAARNLADQEETSKLESQEWTDEKHCLFLKSMESTFVNQLYASIEMFGLQSHKSSASRSKSLKQKQTSTRPSGQFKVLRDGYWSKVDFQKGEDEVEHRKESEAPFSNPWIQRYRNSKIQTNKRYPASTSEFPPSCEDFNGRNIEVSDQNFNDGSLEEDRSTSETDTTNKTRSNDQVVPNGNTIRGDNVVEGQKHPKN